MVLFSSAPLLFVFQAPFLLYYFLQRGVTYLTIFILTPYATFHKNIVSHIIQTGIFIHSNHKANNKKPDTLQHLCTSTITNCCINIQYQHIYYNFTLCRNSLYIYFCKESADKRFIKKQKGSSLPTFCAQAVRCCIENRIQLKKIACFYGTEPSFVKFLSYSFQCSSSV